MTDTATPGQAPAGTQTNNGPQPPQSGSTPPAQRTEQPPTEQAPWEREGETFDAERAKRLLQNLKAERDAARAERETYKSKATEHERSQMSEQQRIETERDEARQARDAATSETARLRAAIKYGLAEDDLDLLGDGTPEQIEARAKRLSERAGGSAPGSSTSSSGRPVEQLRGGSNPSGGDEPDPDQVAAGVRRNR